MQLRDFSVTLILIIIYWIKITLILSMFLLFFYVTIFLCDNIHFQFHVHNLVWICLYVVWFLCHFMYSWSCHLILFALLFFSFNPIFCVLRVEKRKDGWVDNCTNLPLTPLDGTICLAMSRNARRPLHPFYLVMCIQYERLFIYFMNICIYIIYLYL